MNHFKSSFLGNEILLSDKCKSIWGASRHGEIYDEQLINQFYNIDGTRKHNADLELPYPDLSKFEIYTK